eukprot:Tbor_TRINITY_DN1926_c0_g1::TRINITY_DN1926_c0_g1_i1::g.3517::m.3517/K02144/ATPeV1H; V-type H+-transporting ATPase subunit H
MALMLAPEAESAICLVREYKTIDEPNIRVLQQLFANRINEDLVVNMVLQKENTLVKILFTIMTTAHQPAVVGYILRFSADLCQIAPTLCAAFATYNFGEVDIADKLLEIANTHMRAPGIHNPAIYLVAVILSNTPDRHNSSKHRMCAAEKFIKMQKVCLSEVKLSIRDIEFSINALSIFVRRKQLRIPVREAGILEHLPRVLTECCSTGDTASITQLIYETLLTVWIVSHEYGCMAALYRSNILPTVHKVLQRAQSEKVIRMCLMIFSNFCIAHQKYYHAESSNEWVDASIYLLGQTGSDSSGCHSRGPNVYSDLIGIGVMKSLWQLARRKFGDEDITTLVDSLTETLDRNMDEVTSFTEYRGEVMSGVLEWSPCHTSAKFWKENFMKFEENSYDVLIKLKELLLSSRSELTLAVACYDVGELARHHRIILTVPCLEGLKERVMALMSHSNVEVAKNALMAVQKIMVQKWEFIR